MGIFRIYSPYKFRDSTIELAQMGLYFSSIKVSSGIWEFWFKNTIGRFICSCRLASISKSAASFTLEIIPTIPARQPPRIQPPHCIWCILVKVYPPNNPIGSGWVNRPQSGS